MANKESYVTKKNPSADDWIEYNGGLFAGLRGEESEQLVQYAPFVDVQRHAADAGVTTGEYFEQIQARVGSLGNYALKLVRSEMDAASHIIVAHSDEELDADW